MSDLIDRKTVFDVIDKCILEKLEGDTVEIKESLKLITKIYRIPSAQPLKKGKWIPSYSNYRLQSDNWYRCDQCRNESQYPTNFCSCCGADMDGENDV